jgi:hypothetical protein
MPAFPVLQPDGRLAIYSTVVDHFTAFDCSVQEAVEEVSQRHRGDVETAVKEVAAGRIPYPHFETWVDCVAWAIFMHGEDNETVLMAMDRSEKVQDEIYQKVDAYRADDQEEPNA